MPEMTPQSAFLSKPCFGYCAAGRGGGFFRPCTDCGIQFADGLRVGAAEVYGNGFPDSAPGIPDSTVIRAHPCAAGAPKKRGGQDEQASGRSRGGFGTEIHIAADALGNPLKSIPTPGQVRDMTQAEALTDDFSPAAVPADRGYDSGQYRRHPRQRGTVPVIPPRSDRKNPQDYDRHLYEERHPAECFTNRIRHFGHIFSRSDKPAERYLPFLHFAGAPVRLR